MAAKRVKPNTFMTVELDTRDYLLFRSATRHFMTNVPVLTNDVLQEMAKWVTKSAKLRAPRASGFLRDSIDWTTMGTNFFSVTVDAYYGAFQEYGFETHRVFVYDKPSLYAWMMMKGLTMAPYLTVGKPLRSEGYFLNPAFENGLANFKKISDPYFNKAMNAFDKMRKP